MATTQDTIAELAPPLASGSLSAEALLAECLAAIGRHDDGPHGLGAVLRLDPQAVSVARACDADRRAGRMRGPLHGVPMIVKDNIDMIGLPTTSGNRAMAGAMPQCDAVQVARLRAAGAVIVGKANMSEFSFEIRSRSSLGGDVRNPFARIATSGGSSGGTAVAVAAGFAVAGLGTDTGGSIRVPAAYNGLVGLRPTFGLLDMAGVAPLAPSTDTVGPITRCVSDAALLLHILAGVGGPPPPLDLPDDIRGLRVGVLRQAFGTEPAIIAACDAALAALAADGVTCENPVDLPEEVLPTDGEHIVDLEFAGAFDLYLATNFAAGTAPASLTAIVDGGEYLADYRDVLRRRLTFGNAGTAREATLARHCRLGRALASLMQRSQLDAIVYPTSMVTPDSLDSPKGGWAPELAACSGWPALTVPAGMSPAGLPIGLELLAPAGREAMLLRLGRAIERNSGPRQLPLLG